MGRIGYIKVLVSSVFILGLSGCNTAVRMDIPVVTAANQLKMDIPTTDLAPMAFDKALVSVKRGTVIASFPAYGQLMDFSGYNCNGTHFGNSEIEWSAGTSLLSGWSGEIGEVFHGAMSDAGYNVLGDTKKLFGAADDQAAAEYLIGARIVEIRGNFCEGESIWTGLPLAEYSGEFYHKVEWSVYSKLTKRVVLDLTPEGHGVQKQPKKEGVLAAFNMAFGAAAEALAGDQKFYDLMARRAPSVQVKAGEDYPDLSLLGPPVSAADISSWAQDLIQSVVTVRLGGGHGSGFVVSSEGHIMTNYHVVGKAKNVTIVFNNGMEAPGKVLRRDPIRDVALIQIPLRSVPALPILESPDVKLLQTVYAIGSPLRTDLNATVTKGAVSAFRREKPHNLRYIQSDVDISSGNSGGPLVDDFGNVVGISVAGFGGGTSVGLNLFIPIGEGLKALNLEILKDKRLIPSGRMSLAN